MTLKTKKIHFMPIGMTVAKVFGRRFLNYQRISTVKFYHKPFKIRRLLQLVIIAGTLSFLYLIRLEETATSTFSNYKHVLYKNGLQTEKTIQPPTGNPVSKNQPGEIGGPKGVQSAATSAIGGGDISYNPIQNSAEWIRSYYGDKNIIVFDKKTTGPALVSNEKEADELLKRKQALSASLSRRFQQNRDHASDLARSQGWAESGGQYEKEYELQAITPRRVYIHSINNQNAAISTGIEAARQYSEYNLDGKGITAGVWDAGTVSTTHNELVEKVLVWDGSGYVSSHATHVGGTIAASGIDAEAQGMAPASKVLTHDWNNDAGEMALLGMAFPGEESTVQISNHSYDFEAGWAYRYFPPMWIGDINHRESDVFGMYSPDAAAWDEICYTSPYYLPVKSAGNDRSNGAPAEGSSFRYWNGSSWVTKAYNSATDPYGDDWDQGGFDTLPIKATAKNILTVGAVTDAVSGGTRSVAAASITPSSSWGPTDDGRIKPDIVANGWSLKSCGSTHDNAYNSSSGTSMAAANATGSAAIILQYFKESFPGQFLRSSTLKGLILHTADDLGTAGPDYKYGWGLMNADAAVRFIQNMVEEPSAPQMVEAIAQDNATHVHTMEWNGNDPIKVTLTWTDPAGNPVESGIDDRTPKLVNDLDVKIITPSGARYYPFRLDPENPAQAATRGDNTIDNVEQVQIEAPVEAGIYIVEVTGKGALQGGQQIYSLLITGAANNAQSGQTDYATLLVNGSPVDEGVVTPQYGAQEYARGSTVNLVANDEVYETIGERYICRGWVGSGSVPHEGSAAALEVTLSEDSSITWVWNKETRYTQHSTLDGLMEKLQWFPEAQTAKTSKAKEQVIENGVVYFFTHWTIDGVRQQDGLGAALLQVGEINMEKPHEAVAHYLPESQDEDADGMRDWFEVRYFGSTDTDPGADADEDGHSNLEEMVTGTNPLDIGSQFFVQYLVHPVNGRLMIKWPYAPGRTYRVVCNTDPNVAPDAWMEIADVQYVVHDNWAEWQDPSPEVHASCYYSVDVALTP